MTKKNLLKIPFIALLLPTMMMFPMEFFALINYGTAFDKRTLITVGFIALVWIGISAVALIKISRQEKIWDKNSVLFVIFMFFALWFMLNSVWNKGYLSLNPVKAIVTGTMKGDSFLHSAISGGVSTYYYPTAMINDLSFIHYHVFSHIILGTISRIIDVPTVFVYCFLFPMIFVPLFSFLFTAVCMKAKAMLIGGNQFHIGDMIVLCCAVTGWLPTEILESFGDWKSSNFASESYCVANTLALFYLFIWLCGPRKKSAKAWMLFVINPIFIFILFYSKSSVGLLFFGCVGYYLFRKHIKEILYYLLYVYYGVVLLLAIYVGNGRGTSNFALTPFHFVEACSLGGTKAFDIYVIVNFVSLFVLLAFRKIKCGYSLKKFIVSTDYIWDQLAIIVSIVSIIPGCCIEIPGGSAAYFYLALPFYFVILIVGFDIPAYACALLKDNKIIIRTVGALLVLTIVRNSNVTGFLERYDTDVLERQSRSDETVTTLDCLSEPAVNETFYSNIEMMYLLSRDHRDEYAVYVDASSEFLNLYCNERNYGSAYKEMYVYPGLTNMLCLNFVNSDGEYYYDCTGRAIIDVGSDYLWLLNLPQKNDLQTFEEAVATAPENIKYVFRVYENGFELVEVPEK